MAKFSLLFTHPATFAGAASRYLKRKLSGGKKRGTKKKVTISPFARIGALFSNMRVETPVAVYFDGKVDQFYQINEWLKPLEELNKSIHIIFITRSMAVFEKLTKVAHFPVALCVTIDDLMQLYERNNFKCILYVNHANRNFQSLINCRAIHVHINHGESDKLSTITNQSKAYDYAFVVGPAAYDRYRLNLLKKNSENYVMIGRPQLDFVEAIDRPDTTIVLQQRADLAADSVQESSDEAIEQTEDAIEQADSVSDAEEKATDTESSEVEPNQVIEVPDTTIERKIILYAPTWEGTHESMDYSSLNTMGLAIVEQILAHPEYFLIYKPHPNTGVRSLRTKKINDTIRQLIKQSGKGTFVNVGDIRSFYPHVALAIFDNSTVAVDYLIHNKPMLMSDMFYKVAVRQDKPLITHAATLLDEDNIVDLLALVENNLLEDPLAEARDKVRQYYLGDFDYTSGESTTTFISKISNILSEHEVLVKNLDVAVKDWKLSLPFKSDED